MRAIHTQEARVLLFVGVIGLGLVVLPPYRQRAKGKQVWAGEGLYWKGREAQI